MARIEGIRIKNFRSLKDVTLGKLWNKQNIKPLSPLTVVIGKNGAGKSTLFDAFGFLGDCLRFGVEEALDSKGRGGFEKVRTKNQEGSIEFEVYYREDTKETPITYELVIDIDENSRPYVLKERLRQRRKGQSTGRPFSFLILSEGRGVVWSGHKEGERLDDNLIDSYILKSFENLTGRSDKEESSEKELVELEDKRKLGIATLGSLKQHPRISSFRRFIEGWYLSYFTPDAARGLPLAGPQKHLNIHGDNLGNVVQFMEREHKEKFQNILDRISSKIPGIGKIRTESTNDGRLLLCFNDKGYKDPFYAQQMSDGTLKVFAYLLLLEDPSPPQFICIEEPENGLYPKLLEVLAKEFREHTTGHKIDSQIFITTHQPYFVDALMPEEVWVLRKGDNGFSTITRASNNVVIKNMVAEGLPLGALWYSDYLEEK